MQLMFVALGRLASALTLLLLIVGCADLDDRDIRQVSQAACVVDADCDDGDPCNGVETCDGLGAGTCIAGTNALAGVSCSDGNVCNGDETCDGSGACGAGTAAADGTDCDDGDFCNGAEVCAAGVCGAATSPCGAGTVCAPIVCNETTDSCDVVVEPDTTSCDDGDFCNGDETCDGAGNCGASPGSPCAPSTACATVTCDEVNDVCDTVNAPTTTSCDDGSFCNGVEMCDGAGNCGASPGTPCAAGTTCKPIVCDEAADSCTAVDAPAFTPCEDGSFCTEGESCNGNGSCGAGAAYNGSAKDCGVTTTCQQNSCDEANDTCVSVNAPSTTDCSDGLFCTENEKCDGNGACGVGVGAGQPRNCGTNTQCTTFACNETTDTCDTTQLTSACDDGLFCTVGETCNGAGNCGGGGPRNCGTNTQCTTYSCDEAADACNTIQSTAACNDGLFCTLNETCNGAGACTGGTPRNCGTDTQCTDYSCNETSDACDTNHFDSSVSCDDNLGCSDNDVCDGTGKCVGTKNDANCLDTPCALNECTDSGCQYNTTNFGGQECRAASGGCDEAEFCNTGDPICPPDEIKANGETCLDGACGGGTQVREVTCNGVSKVCNIPSCVDDADCSTGELCIAGVCNVDCVGFACDGAVPPTAPMCLTVCASDAECLSSHRCEAGDCVERTGLGVACTASSECGIGNHCVDGVCCNEKCEAQCQACDVAGSVGSCTAIPAGEQPHVGMAPGPVRPLCTANSAECAGYCNGSSVSGCEYPGVATSCSAPSCSTTLNQEFAQPKCDAQGSCIQPAGMDCYPYACDGTVCHRDSCATDSDCASGLACIGGACIKPLDDGDACTLNAQCASGYCVDSVCCDSACSGQCEACDVSGAVGECTTLADGESPHGLRPDCAGSGSCAGTCDGTSPSKCAFPGTETLCRAGECDESSGMATIEAFCSGNGQCPSAQSVACTDGCDGVFCANSDCLVDGDCDSGQVCLFGMCADPGQPGDACAQDNDCGSGFCTDGVCCNSACGGQCEACDVSGSEGTCTAVSAGQQPHGGRQQCSGDGGVCSGSCDGTTTDSCSYPSGDVCRAGACASNTATVEAVCDGSGYCPDLQEQPCSTSCVSGGNVCDGACATDPSACAAGEYCSAGECVQLLDQGEACGADSQCSTGFCVDGLCCDSACDSQCAACNVRRSEGTCTPTTGAPGRGRAACDGTGTCGATCDGKDADACNYPSSNTSCGEASCSNGVVSKGSACDGSGRCVDGSTERCSTLMCDGSACADRCADDAECFGELICLDGACVDDPFIDGVDKGSCGCRVVGGEQKERGSLPILLGAALALVWAVRRRTALRDKAA